MRMTNVRNEGAVVGRFDKRRLHVQHLHELFKTAKSKFVIAESPAMRVKRHSLICVTRKIFPIMAAGRRACILI